MVSKGKPSDRSAVRPLSNEQVAKIAREHALVDPTRPPKAGTRRMNEREIQEQNPQATKRLLAGTAWVLRSRAKVRAWGLEHIPEDGVYIMAATHVSMFDVFVPMTAQFEYGRRPRYMAKAELAKWPLLGRWFRLVGMQPVPRRKLKEVAVLQRLV